jgi:hypothetical protein
MLDFPRKLLKKAAAETFGSMGTTALAVGIALAIWLALIFKAFGTGGLSAARANWDSGVSLAVLVWLVVLAWHARKLYYPLLREHRRVFRLLALNQDQITDPDRISIWCLLEFTEDIGPTSLTVRVTTDAVNGPITRVVHTEELVRVAKNEQKRLTLGSLRIMRPDGPPIHSIWGSEPGAEALRPGQVTIMTDSKNVIEISVGSQTHRCRIEFVTAPPGAISAAMYLTDEDRSQRLVNTSGRESSEAWFWASLAVAAVVLLEMYKFVSEHRWPFSEPTFASQLTSASWQELQSNLKDALIDELSPGTLRKYAELPHGDVTLYVASFTNPHDGAQFLAAYIPRTDDTVELAKEMIKQHRELLKRLAPEKNGTHIAAKGQHEALSADYAVFTGLIYIYYDKLLTEAELQSIDDMAKRQGVNVILRNPTYLTR